MRPVVATVTMKAGSRGVGLRNEEGLGKHTTARGRPFRLTTVLLVSLAKSLQAYHLRISSTMRYPTHQTRLLSLVHETVFACPRDVEVGPEP